MSSLRPLLLSVTILLTTGLSAQTEHNHHSAYADEADSGIAGLTAAEIEQLQNGDGMGLARPAELNHYPGPKHVLDATVELGLTAEQHRETERVFAAMRAEAIRIGNEIVEKERTLSRRFEHRHIDEESLAAITAEIAALRGTLRYTHLHAHLEMVKILTAEQIERYDVIRGYKK